MSLLTADEKVKAVSQGWDLEHVWDLGREAWFIYVVPPAGKVCTDYEALAKHVVNRARTGEALAIKAMRLIVAGVPQPKKKGTK